LKIGNGERLLSNTPATFQSRKTGSKSTVRATLNNGTALPPRRYFFLYDETKGNFSMVVTPINYAEDTGIWQCHVTIQKQGKMQSMTSRNRIKNRPQKQTDDSGVTADNSGLKMPSTDSEMKTVRPSLPFMAFTRNEQSTIEIARYATKL
uniref:Ig-like domain-containing protein n=1 Tax=Gongylonema pulchrum TaxID=637853 RepID=A0A183E2M8_9BILA